MREELRQMFWKNPTRLGDWDVWPGRDGYSFNIDYIHLGDTGLSLADVQSELEGDKSEEAEELKAKATTISVGNSSCIPRFLHFVVKIAEYFPNLESLSISNVVLHPVVFSIIGGIKSLKSLHISIDSRHLMYNGSSLSDAYGESSPVS